MKLRRWLRQALVRSTWHLARRYGVRWTVRYLWLGWKLGWAGEEESQRFLSRAIGR